MRNLLYSSESSDICGNFFAFAGTTAFNLAAEHANLAIVQLLFEVLRKPDRPTASDSARFGVHSGHSSSGSDIGKPQSPILF